MTTCQHCIHYQRNRLNPEAGLGSCRLGLVSRYPNERHSCRKGEEGK